MFQISNKPHRKRLPQHQPAQALATDQKTTNEPKADLVIDSVQLSGPYPRDGDDVFLRVTVKNQGEVASGSFTTSADSHLGGGHRARYSSLRPGQKRTETFGPLGTRGSLLEVTIKADSRNQVDESRENNNRGRIQIPVMRR